MYNTLDELLETFHESINFHGDNVLILPNGNFASISADTEYDINDINSRNCVVCGIKDSGNYMSIPVEATRDQLRSIELYLNKKAFRDLYIEFRDDGSSMDFDMTDRNIPYVITKIRRHFS